MTESTDLTPEQRAARRKRLAEVFGDVLPEQTRDDIDSGAGDSAASEEWLKRQVPPHHG